ncbi:hypothetical protein ABW16_21680 [Mycolicibacter heraklionensis]|uniref:Uncharacterized protein n=2 Tax=Mycolicibacter heraklionensis TaxID=512402 RepID=A0ABR5FA40_9MYCO|nr:hypothetical protein ABW16_21680 [Mycolicibacter heraklionensis]
MFLVKVLDSETGMSAQSIGNTQSDAEGFARAILAEADHRPELALAVCVDCRCSFLSDGHSLVEYSGRVGSMCEDCQSDHDADVEIARDAGEALDSPYRPIAG